MSRQSFQKSAVRIAHQSSLILVKVYKIHILHSFANSSHISNYLNTLIQNGPSTRQDHSDTKLTLNTNDPFRITAKLVSENIPSLSNSYNMMCASSLSQSLWKSLKGPISN